MTRSGDGPGRSQVPVQPKSLYFSLFLQWPPVQNRAKVAASGTLYVAGRDGHNGWQ